MDDSGMNIEVLAPNNGPDKICWSAGGEDIFFSGYGYLFKYSIESDNLIELDVCSAFPSANPDGDHIVYLHHCISWFSPLNGQLFVMDADGRNKHQITFSEGGDSLR